MLSNKDILEKIILYYSKRLFTNAQMVNFVKSGYLTKEQYLEITGEKYPD